MKARMQKINYQKKLDQLISELETADTKVRPTLLLHACCGPCSSYVLEYLAKYFQITVFYYNPNIYPAEEYKRRLEELKNLYKRFPPALENHVKIIEADYQPEEFYQASGTREKAELATEPEKGERCYNCYKLRLEKSFRYACEHNFDYFCTTLSISPFKDAQKINEIGELLTGEAEKNSASDTSSCEKIPRWLYSDFKKNNGFKRSLELSEEYQLYRQQYCGCIFSLQNSR